MYLIYSMLEPPHDKINKVACAPSEDLESDQSLRCLHEETLGPQLSIEHTAKTLISQIVLFFVNRRLKSC